MANNCLVTKLKGSVDNDNLPILGTLRFTVLNNQELYLVGVEEVSIKGNGHFCSNNTFSDNIGKVLTSADAESSIRAYIALDEEGVPCDLVIKDNYGLKKILNAAEYTFKNITGDFSQFNFRKLVNINTSTSKDSYGNLDSADFSEIGNQSGMNYGFVIENKNNVRNNIKLNIAKFSEVTNPGFIQLIINRSRVYGNISALSACTTLTKLDLNNDDIAGDISSLAELTSLTLVSLWNNEWITGNIESLYKLTNTTRLLLSGTPVTGTIEGLAVGMLAQGKTTEIQVTAKNATFHGVELADGRLSLNFGTDTVTVRQANSTGAVVGTYSNGSWTYA